MATPDPIRRPAYGPRPWPGLGRRDTEPDLALVVEQLEWLRAKADRQEARIAGVEYARRATLARASAVALVVAQLVLLCLPWWALRSNDSDPADALAGPWTLLGDAGELASSLSVGLVGLVVLPLLVYLAAGTLVLVAAFGDRPRVAVASSVACACAVVAALAQSTIIAAMATDSGDALVDATAAAPTAVVLWIAVTVATATFGSD